MRVKEEEKKEGQSQLMSKLEGFCRYIQSSDGLLSTRVMHKSEITIKGVYVALAFFIMNVFDANIGIGLVTCSTLEARCPSSLMCHVLWSPCAISFLARI